MVRAAVLAAVGQPLEIRDDVEVDEPGPGEVQVRMVASGVCHSDRSARDGVMLVPTPVVLGHEGAGVVERVGPGVTGVAPGDPILVSWVPQCGTCFHCERQEGHLCDHAAVSMGGAMLDGTTRMRSGGLPLRQLAASGTFAEVVVVPGVSVVPLPADIDLPVAALLGCSVLTGVGAVFNTSRVERGDTVAVVGCGGVGLNVVQGARLAGAGRIIAVDASPPKLDLAARFGATDAVDASSGDPVSAVMALTGQRGADVVFEVVGRQATIEQAVAMTRRGGQTVLVGIPAMDVTLAVPAFLGLVLSGRTISGCWYGSSNVRRDVPRLLRLYRAGRLELDALVSRTIPLDGVNDALDALGGGEGARTVIVHRGA
ncbi:MAG TPA: Zn-dependent alcohol dehydrogenase [Acidimicrobiales bacterium]|nr:Zn-dependent alcohol dehydrogenase [Acidimicrobiales bacterium]